LTLCGARKHAENSARFVALIREKAKGLSYIYERALDVDNL